MINTQMVKFMHYINQNKDTLYHDFQKSEEVRRLLNPNQITTFFQPILTLEAGSTVAYEVLNRPNSSALFPTPDTFYDYVGKSNSSLEVERFISNLALHRYTEEVNTLQEPTNSLLFLNIQPQVLADTYYQEEISNELLEKYQLQPEQIVLELTERESNISHLEFLPVLEKYREQGFNIALDDAGTGYNSLQTLIYLNPDYIKIDKSLIRDITEFNEKQYLVEFIIDFAEKSGSKVIAEGIETTSELTYLQQIGVDLGQGYALGKPKPNLYKGKFPVGSCMAN